jgi:hypothetical protein
MPIEHDFLPANQINWRIGIPNGSLRRVELHWYEAHGVGKRDFKIKGYLDKP